MKKRKKMEEKTVFKSILENAGDPKRLDENISLFTTLSKHEKITLLNALAQSNEEKTVRLINLIYDLEEDKDILKHIRKVLYILKTKGIRVEEPPKKGPPAINLKKKDAKEDKKVRSYITNFDYFNEMFVLIAIEFKKKNFLVINGEIALPEGLKELTLNPISDDEFNNIIESIKFEKTDKLVLAEAPVSFSYHILKEGSNISKKYPKELNALKKTLKEHSSAFREGFNLYELTVPEDIYASDIDEILSHQFFEFFRFRWDGFEEDKKKYMDLKNPAIFVPQYIIEEKKTVFIDSLASKENINILIPLLKTVLEAYAYIFYAHKKYAFYKGLIDSLKRDEALRNVILYLIKNELEYEEEKSAFNENNMVINPFEFMKPYE